MDGDSADPIIADAYAMGVRNFDVAAALRYMVKGATQMETNHGLEIERQYLSQYLTQHYINAGSLDLTSIDYSLGGSATLEYAIDDFAIAQLATAVHQPALASSHGAARLELGVRVQPGHRLHPGTRQRRQLPARTGLRGLAARAGRPDGVRGGQRRAVHLVRPPGRGGRGRAHGRRRRSSGEARDVLHPTERHPRCALRLVGQRARRVGAVGIRLPRRARPDPARRARHRRQRVRRRTGRRAGQRRPRRHLVVVRVGRPRPLPAHPRHRQPGAGQSALPVNDHLVA